MRPNLFDYFSIFFNWIMHAIMHADHDDRAPALSFAVSLRTVDLLTSRLLIATSDCFIATSSEIGELQTTPKKPTKTDF